MSQQPNLINTFRAFYHLNIASDLSTSAISLFMAILYRSNELGFPEKFRITNSELCSNTGLALSSLDNCRKTLCNYRCDDQWLIKYIPGTTHQCGTYFINYDLLKFNLLNGINLDKTLSKPANIPILEDTIQDSSSSVGSNDLSDGDLENKKDDDDDDVSKLAKIYQLIGKADPRFHGPQTEFQREFIDSDIFPYSIQQIEKVCQKAGLQKRSDILSYIAGGLKDFEFYYGKIEGATPKKLGCGDFSVDEIWDNQDEIYRLVSMDLVGDGDMILLLASRLAEIYSQTPNRVYDMFGLHFGISKEGLINYHNDRLAKEKVRT